MEKSRESRNRSTRIFSTNFFMKLKRNLIEEVDFQKMGLKKSYILKKSKQRPKSHIVYIN